MAFRKDNTEGVKRRTASLREIVRAYMHYVSGVKKIAAVQITLLCLDGLFQAAMPGALGYIVNQLQKDAKHFVDHQLLTFAILAAVGSIVFYFVSYIQNFLTAKITSSVVTRMQSDLYSHLQRLSADFFQRTQVGEITARLMGDVNAGVGGLYNAFAGLTWTLSVLIPSCITMAYLNFHLFLVFLGVAAIFIGLTRGFLPTLRDLQRDVADQAGAISSRVTEDMASIKLIRAYSRESVFVDQVEGLCEEYLSLTLKRARTSVMFVDLAQTFLIFVAPLSLLYIGSMFVGPKLSVGGLVAFYGYWLVASYPINSIISSAASLLQAFSSFDRVQEFFRETPLVKDAPGAGMIEVSKGRVEFRDVVFRYPTSEGDDVLQGLTFAAQERKSLALVGESGAGKSTIVQLVLRFYDPISGQVIIDGQDISKVQQESLRRQIGFVMQDTILLSGSVRFNMQLAQPDATDDQIEEALRNAEAWDFVNELPYGLNTVLGEKGSRLSGGQKQRISIARVFLKNPPIVIFDEATSALDAVTERKIQKTMERLYHGRTSIIIAHRLSTIVNCDKIILLNRGRILAEGSHKELIDTCDEYRELCTKQRL